jgi:hypothetical protein
VDLGEETGWCSLTESARTFERYDWLERRLFEVLGGWVPTVPEPEVKRLLGVHCHHHAWRAGLWRERMPALPGSDSERSPLGPTKAMVELVDALAAPSGPTSTVERLTGTYRVALPHLAGAYTAHLDRTSRDTDGPTARTLQLVLHDVRQDWQEGELLLEALIATSEEAERAASHQARLERLLDADRGAVG